MTTVLEENTEGGKKPFRPWFRQRYLNRTQKKHKEKENEKG